MIHLEERHEKIIKDILNKYPYKFYAFGSRVKGTYRTLSDLDLCYKDEIPLRDLRKISDEFSDSNLPFKVDIINFSRCSDSFKEIIEKEMVPFFENNINNSEETQ